MKRRYIYGTSALLFAAALFGTAGQIGGWIHRTMTPAGLVGMNLMFAGLIAWMWSGARCRVVLYEDAIEVVGRFSARTLRRTDIRGHRTERMGRWGGEFCWVLVPNDQRERVLRLPPSLESDRALQSWMSSLPLVRE